MNFGDIEEKYCDYGKAPVVIIPVPFDETSSWVKGAAKGPDAILDASANMWLYDIATKKEVYLRGLHTAEPVGDTDDVESMVEEVEAEVRKHLQNGKLPVVAGGNHSVSIGAIRAVAGIYENLTVVQLDAHADLMDEWNGSPLNHACVMARAREVAETVHIGIRTLGPDELPAIQPGRLFFAHDIVGKKDWYDSAIEHIEGPVYLTVDLDVFDPSIMPATGTPVPAGMVYQEVYDFIKYLTERKNVVAFDVVELCPIPNIHAPNYLAAQLIYQTISLLID
jgi:agmatinase